VIRESKPAQAARHVAEGKRIVEHQRALVAKAKRRGGIPIMPKTYSINLGERRQSLRTPFGLLKTKKIQIEALPNLAPAGFGVAHLRLAAEPGEDTSLRRYHNGVSLRSCIRLCTLAGSRQSCLPPGTITSSRLSRRIVPIGRSAYALHRGGAGKMDLSRLPMARMPQ
jgi:hypothetical protein